MMSANLALSAIVLLPLLGAILNGFFLRRAPLWSVAGVAVLAVLIPFLLSVLLVAGPVGAGEQVIDVPLFNWITLQLGDSSQIFSIPFHLRVDRLSGLMLLVVTGVGSLIHLYSVGYMAHENGVYRFFSYMNLFVFSMLILVTGANLLVMFLGWEGVGLCSYLLIGYWFDKDANAAAGMKAFIVNRVGDLGFLLAMFFALRIFGTLDFYQMSHSVARFAAIWSQVPGLQQDVLLFCLSIIVAVTGKSAQLPLYIWLPDAMAGPTPVSALIHAATMVTAGVYLLARLSFVFVLSPEAMTVVACLGAATAIFAATIALAQNDIKKVLAYSTVSQLGFMILACGVGAFEFGIAHLTTHAFFKALLFLAAGSVIHALHHEQDIRKMGGLVRRMPITSVTFMIGVLAIIGFPGLAGFFSKDEILFHAWTGPFGHPLYWTAGIFASLLTSFYMIRLMILVFFGEARGSVQVKENSWFFTLPLVVLAVLSAIGGMIAIPKGIASLLGLQGDSLVVRWLKPVMEQAHLLTSFRETAVGESHHLEWLLMADAVGVMLLGSGAAILLYRRGPDGAAALAARMGFIYRLVLDKWRVDEAIEVALLRPLRRTADICYAVGDRFIIERFLVNGVPSFIRNATLVASDAQSGSIRNYLKLFFLGLIALTLFLLW